MFGIKIHTKQYLQVNKIKNTVIKGISTPSLDIVHSYNREWIYCILYIGHILEQTVQLYKLSDR